MASMSILGHFVWVASACAFFLSLLYLLALQVGMWTLISAGNALLDNVY